MLEPNFEKADGLGISNQIVINCETEFTVDYT